MGVGRGHDEKRRLLLYCLVNKRDSSARASELQRR